MTGVVEQRLDVLGHETRVLTAGNEDAPPLLLLHDGAWGGSASVSWSGAIGFFAEEFRVIAPDLLGFGETAKTVQLDSSPYTFRIQHLLATLDKLNVIGPIHVVGTSFGGSVGLHLLALHRERVASLVSVSGTGGPWRTSFGIQILGSWDGTRDALETIVATLAEEAPAFSLQEHIDERLASASIPGHYRAMMAPGVALPASLKRVNTAAAEWPRQLEGIDVPVLLVQGLRDPLVDADWTKHLTAVLPRSERLQLDTLHSPNLSDPQGFAEMISHWVARIGSHAHVN